MLLHFFTSDRNGSFRNGSWFLLGAAYLCSCAMPEPEVDARPAPSPWSGFTRVTEAAGLGAFGHATGAAGGKWFPEIMGSGGGFIDYDGDQRLDLLLVAGGSWHSETPALRLYRNTGDGAFTDVSSETGLDDIPAYGFGLAVADYDNDADPDVYLTTLYENLLLRNDGIGDGTSPTFTETGRATGVAGDSAWSTAALFFDADLDGHLDLFVGNYVAWTPERDLWCSADGTAKSYCTPELYQGIPSRFYRNNGDGTFTDRSAEAGFLPNPGKTLGAAAWDFNADGWPDLAVANDLLPDQLYENNGDGTFREIGVTSGMAFDERGRTRAGMGLDVGVVDDTGQPTVFVGNYSNEVISVYRRGGNGLFLDRAARSQIGRASRWTLAFGLFLFDADLDADLDLFVANGHLLEEMDAVQDNVAFRQPPHLFLNDGAGLFTDAAPGLGGPLATPLLGRGAAFGDYDRDGDLDVLVTENGGPVHLLRNDLRSPGGDTSGTHVLRVRLEGRTGNRDALGARLIVTAGGTRQVREIRTNASYLSAVEATATFGLGEANRVDSLRILWPGGRTNVFTNLPANQTVKLVEGNETLEGTEIGE